MEEGWLHKLLSQEAGWLHKVLSQRGEPRAVLPSRRALTKQTAVRMSARGRRQCRPGVDTRSLSGRRMPAGTRSVHAMATTLPVLLPAFFHPFGGLFAAFSVPLSPTPATGLTATPGPCGHSVSLKVEKTTKVYRWEGMLTTWEWLRCLCCGGGDVLHSWFGLALISLMVPADVKHHVYFA